MTKLSSKKIRKRALPAFKIELERKGIKLSVRSIYYWLKVPKDVDIWPAEKQKQIMALHRLASSPRFAKPEPIQ